MRSSAEFYLRLVFAGMMATGSLQLCGCHKTVLVYGPSALPALTPADISDNDKKAVAAKKQLPGIPFYNHYGVCSKETLWLEPQTALSLTVTPDGGTPVTQTITLKNKAFHDPDSDAPSLVSALKEIEGSHEITDTDKKFCPANVAKNWSEVRDRYKAKPIDETNVSTDSSQIKIEDAAAQGILVRMSNTADIGTAVDYSRVYYLNAKSPLIGTGTVDAKLNTDGTLSEGSASVDDETLGDVLTAAATVGSGGLTAWSTLEAAKITEAASIAAAAVTPAAVPGGARVEPYYCAAGEGWPAVRTKKIKFEFVVTPGGFKHDHKKVTPLSEADGGKCIVSADVLDGSYTVTPVSDESKPDKNAIGVSGTITLPKAKDSATPKP
jgi:hypothetical protein